MQYRTSVHYREEPHAEVEAALLAGNTIDSVQMTLASRLMTEIGHTPRDPESIQRIQDQLAHIAGMTADMAIAS